MVTTDRGRFGRLGAAVVLLVATFGWGQTVPATPTSTDRKPCADRRPVGAGKAQADGSCAPAGKDAVRKADAGAAGKVDPGAAQRFPYPGENSGENLQPAVPDAPAKVGVPDAPAAGSGSAGGPRGAGGEKPRSAEAFPYPGETGPAADSSSSGSDGSSSSSSSAPDSSASGGRGLDDVGSEGSTRATRRRLPKPERIQSDEDRATEDMTVAKFYQQSGNLQAAYLRAKDAVKMQPADAETHFVLAGVLEKMRRREEAAVEFEAYLKLDPDGEHAKAAQKAIGGK